MQYGLPVCCVRDFNAITEESEKYGGSKQLNQNSWRFCTFVFNAGMVDLGYKGPTYTWTNKPHSATTMHVRLDKVLAMPTWCNLYPEAYVNHIHRLHSDHAPILL
jgi:exonuclease III